MRLDKYLSDAGIGTRSQVKKLIAAGRVCVDGAVIRQAGMQLNDRTADVTADGKKVRYARFEYYMLNKPQGVISASRVSSGGNVCVVDLITDRIRDDLFPVGRLDKDTEGLLLITNDGQMAHALLSPGRHVDKTYYVETDRTLPDDDRLRLERGIEIGDEKPTLPCRIEPIVRKCLNPAADWMDASRTGDKEDAGAFRMGNAGAANASLHRCPGYSCYITIREGRYHQIKRMFAAVGLTVTYLKRLSMGPLILDPELSPGEYRPLASEEIRMLMNH